MNHLEHLKKIQTVLTPYRQLWNQEVLEVHPFNYSPQINSWVDLIENLTLEQKELFIAKKIDQLDLPEDLVELIEKILLLERIEVQAVPINIFFKSQLHLRQKKTHEINQILSFIEANKNFEEIIIDFAGGIGNLANALTKYAQKSVHCLELNQDLIETGRKRYPDVHFEQGNIELLQGPSTAKDCSMIGLHCCGDLTYKVLDIFKNAHQAKSILSIGCCYHKIAKHAFFSTNALHLANFHNPHENLSQKYSVKKHRYLFELLVKKFHPLTKKIELRSSPIKSYESSFLTYTHQNLPKLGLKIPDSDVLAFSQNQQNIKVVDRLFAMGLLRSTFAQIIELALTLEKYIHLSRFVNHIEIVELFDSKISPRNLGIFAQKGRIKNI
jgi:hypothetical protein